jgi:hypothetical protein
MKILINNLVTVFNNAKTAGRVHVNSVRKGINNEPAQLTYGEFPYISFDDGGQKVDEIKSDTAIKRNFTVIIEMAVQVLNTEQALDNILDLTDEVKAELELLSNKTLLYDGHVWAMQMNTFGWGDDQKFFRGVQILCEFWKLEDRYLDY